jgi:kinesin family protein 5
VALPQLGLAVRLLVRGALADMNLVGPRSHSVFVLTVKQKLPNGTTKGGKLNFIDLAGSEKIAKTGASGDTLEEAKKINQSLSALGMVIKALADGKPHIPYRDSKLTRLLQDSLGGNTKTTLIIALSPADDNIDESISTLNFAKRAKTIKNVVKVSGPTTISTRFRHES